MDDGECRVRQRGHEDVNCVGLLQGTYDLMNYHC